MFEALEDVIRAKGNRLAELRDILLSKQPSRWRETYPVRFPWLNSTQEAVVNKVLCAKDVAIVHGPPGTGKTTTHLRDPAPRKSSPGLCTKQHGRRLDCREAGGPRSTCIAYRQSEPGK